MDTIIEYDFYWEIEEFTAPRKYPLRKPFNPPNTGCFCIFVEKGSSHYNKKGSYVFYIESFKQKVKVEFDIIIQSVPNKWAELPSRESYILNGINIPQPMATVYPDEKTLRVTYNVIPFFHDFLIFKCHLKVYIPSDKKEMIVPVSSVKESCNLCSDFKRLYDSKEMSDLTIVIGKETLLAHKFVLATRSPVLRAMMDNDWLESSTKTLKVTDTDLLYFDSFLKYLYFSEIEDKSYDAVRNLYMLADKYQVDFLKAECRDILNVDMKMDNVCQVLELAHLFTDDTLKQKAVKFIERNFSQVSKMQEWIKMCKDNPALASDVLAVLTLSLNKSNQ